MYIGTLLWVCIHLLWSVFQSATAPVIQTIDLLEVSGSACGISYNSSLILVVWPFRNLKFELSLSADNNHVSISKHYQLFPKKKLIQTNSLITSVTVMHATSNFKVLNCWYFRNGQKFVNAANLQPKFTDIVSLCICLVDESWGLVHHIDQNSNTTLQISLSYKFEL